MKLKKMRTDQPEAACNSDLLENINKFVHFP